MEPTVNDREENQEVYEKLEDRLESAVDLLKSLSNERWLLAVCYLCRNGETSVGDLEKIVGLSQSALSQHLARLRKDKIVETRRSAQTIYYYVSDERVLRILDTLIRIFCPEKVQDDR